MENQKAISSNKSPNVFLIFFMGFVLLSFVCMLIDDAQKEREMSKRDEERIKQEQIQFASNKFQTRLKKERWERNHNAPEREIFRKRSENFVDKVDENSLDIVVEVPVEQLKKAHVGITNYLSNVGGKIDKTEDTTKSATDTKLYYLKVPQGAKFAENLEEELDKYLCYDDVMETTDDGEVKSE